MFQIETRQQLIDYILRKIGNEVVDVELTENNIIDAINHSIEKYTERAEDGQIRKYISTKVNKDRKEVILPEDIITVNSVYYDKNPSFRFSLMGDKYFTPFFGGRTFPTYPQFNIINYYVANSYLKQIGFFSNNNINFIYNQFTHTLYLNYGKDVTETNITLWIECWKAVDDEQYTNMYNHRWIKEFAVAEAMLQQGINMHKYDSITLQSNVSISPQNLISEAKERKDRLLEELETMYVEPPKMFMG